MADDNFFKVNGAKQLGKELKELSRTMQSKILRPGMRQGAAVIRKAARELAPKDTGMLKKNIKSKVYTKKQGGKGVVARIGVLGDAGYNNQDPPRPIALYGYAQNQKTHFLDDALTLAEAPAMYKLLSTTQQKMDAFHASKGDPGKAK
jgi:HK97 gp10 family phage protein